MWQIMRGTHVHRSEGGKLGTGMLDAWNVPCLPRSCPVASLFRPHAAVGRDDERSEQPVKEAELSVGVVEPPILPPQDTAIECEGQVLPRGEITLALSRQQVGIHQALAGRTLTVRANQRSVQFLLDGHLVTTSRPGWGPEGMACLTMHLGARPAGPAPAPAVLPRAGNGTAILAAGEPVESDRESIATGSSAWSAAVTWSGSPSPAARSRCGWTGKVLRPHTDRLGPLG